MFGCKWSRKGLASSKSVGSPTKSSPPSLLDWTSATDTSWEGLMKAPLYIVIWYIFSACTLFLNKYILTFLEGDPDMVGYTQIVTTTLCGCMQVYIPRLYYYRSPQSQVMQSPAHAKKYTTFYRDMLLLGIMRVGSVVLGLVSLKSVAVSFTETIKASAPLFTVVMAWLMLGEISGVYVNFSLLPIMVGLILTSYTELSFQAVGFLAALLNNILDCIQNVFSKKLLSNLQAYTPTELQFYSSVAAVSIQVPVWFSLRGLSLYKEHMTWWMAGCLLLDGLCFHLQSIAAYYVVSVISPVSFSVSNTVKRALLTVLSVIIFGNKITVLTLLGTVMVIGGVFVYNSARNHEADLRRKQELSSGDAETV
ncbi:solute carrier family 35 member E2A-like [Sycon ciliatum]|uniref:solute carrier family 35 member E2A-like n=1 Tax=Sycon ciliatum TaxID=27933 RepID=UPI0020ADAA60|eukprot:scpid45542/ scgid17655/ Solute carrier family 35 member E2